MRPPMRLPTRLPTRHGVSPSVVAVPTAKASSRQTMPSVLDFLATRLPGIARSEWAERLAQGLVLLEDGQCAQAAQSCRPGQRLYYYRSLAHEPLLPMQARTVFEDAHLLVVDKPHFMPVTPVGRYVQQSLLVQLKQSTGNDDLVPLHRIDRETAGLVLLGKRLPERDAYHALFRDKAIFKSYLAVAAYRPDAALPPVHTSRMAEDPAHFFKMREIPGMANSETRLQLLRHDGQRGLYQLQPLSGKRHQLRVHMNALGLPIEGDQLYPEVLRGPDAEEDYQNPLQLLAQAIAFTDPVTGEARRFESALQLRESANASFTVDVNFNA